MKEKLSAGLCDTCKHCDIMYEGNGTDEPLYSQPWCIKENIEIIPAPDSHKELRVTECDNYSKS